ncbi:MAG: helix-turn-helix transcriptional regulator [Agathobacter sp.]|nr:helix-turn-helix transcriptional regulator [Agathobacter sp.]
MFEIDRAKFGAFVSELRKEKGITQKELAEKLCISDKAISKWETGNSIPDVSLLVPLAEILGVSTTELLECRRIEQPEAMNKEQTDNLVKKVIEISEDRYTYKSKKNIVIYLIGAFLSVVGMFCLYLLQKDVALLQTIDITPVYMVAAFAIGFGAYFWIFMKERLPAYYDENEISVYVDGILHMNMPGVVFNNNNWPHIVEVLRCWSIFGMIFFPFVYLPLMAELKEYGIIAQLTLVLGAVLGGLFIPVYVIARKYQYGDKKPMKTIKKKSNWIWLVIIFVIVLSSLGFTGNLGTISSATKIMYFSNAGRDHWSAEYQYLDGYIQRNLWMEEDDVLKISIETIEGEIDLTIKDSEGNVIFSEKSLETKEFQVAVSGKITIRIDGDKHEGSFDFQ